MTDPIIPVDLGSRLGLVSADDGLVAACTDTRLGTEDRGRQDIAAAIGEIVDAAPSATRQRIGLGFLVLSMLALVGWALSGRSGAAGRRAGPPGGGGPGPPPAEAPPSEAVTHAREPAVDPGR